MKQFKIFSGFWRVFSDRGELFPVFCSH